MRHTVNVRPHATTFPGLKPGTRSARPYTFLFLCLCAFACGAVDVRAYGACTTPTFAPASVYDTGRVRRVAHADFNHDGKLDFATLQPGEFGSVKLYFGDGAGAFTQWSGVITLGRSPISIGAGNFDGDEFPDLVVVNEVSAEGEATVVLNRGLAFDVRFPGIERSTNASNIVSTALAVADLNLDGRSDLAVTGLAGSAKFDVNKIKIALSGGTHYFATQRTFSVANFYPFNVVAGDFNGDGKPDLTVAFQDFSATIRLISLTGDGAGEFNFKYTNSTGGYGMASGDFNSDDKSDLASLINSSLMSVLLSDGAGDFGAPSFISAKESLLTHLTTGDFNGDGHVDLVVSDLRGSIALIFAGDGAGNFTRSAAHSTGAAQPSFIDTADFNGDGKLDLIVAHESTQKVSVLLNTCGTGNAAASLNFSAPVYNAPEDGLAAVVVTVNRYGSLAGEATVSYATADGTAVSPADYKPATGVLTFADGEASKSFAIELVNDNLDEPDETIKLTLSNATGATAPSTLGTATLNILDDDPTLFNISGTTVAEGNGRASLTVTRTGHGSFPATVDYRTTDADTFTVSCADTTNNAGGAYARCDFATVVGRLDFAAGELQKTISVPIIDDGHDEAAETFSVVLSNPAGASLGANAAATVTISDDDAAGASNPIFTTPFFVRQHYLDFLSREPEAGEPWSNILNQCPNVNNDERCDRITVSQSFLGAPEFRVKGLYVFRFYKVAFGRLPEYAEIVSDMSFVAGATEEEVYARKALLAQRFIERDDFRAAHGFRSNDLFVYALLSPYQLTEITTPDPAQPDGTTKVTHTRAALVTLLDAGALSRAQVFRAIADSDEVSAREFDNAFVAMQYYGYLRRKPDPDGYAAWLAVFKRGDTRTMVDGFLNSSEYKLRFGNP